MMAASDSVGRLTLSGDRIAAILADVLLATVGGLMWVGYYPLVGRRRSA